MSYRVRQYFPAYYDTDAQLQEVEVGKLGDINRIEWLDVTGKGPVDIAPPRKFRKKGWVKRGGFILACIFEIP